MLWFYKMENKYGKYAIPNLTRYLIICYAVGSALELSAGLGGTMAAGFLSYMTLDVAAILHGQIWRLVTWLLIPPGAPSIFILITLYCYYRIGNMLESTWGTFRYNVFMFSGVIFTILGAFVLYLLLAVMGRNIWATVPLESLSAMTSYMFSTYYVSMSIFLAFAITFPDIQMLFMFVIPIKTKILGGIYVLMMIYQIMQTFRYSGMLMGIATAVVIGFSLLNVLVFFIITRKSFRTPSQIKRQKAYQKHVVKMKKLTRHKCAICGRTEETDPDEQFRFCSKCEGNYEYCSKHIYTHAHVKNGQ